MIGRSNPVRVVPCVPRGVCVRAKNVKFPILSLTEIIGGKCLSENWLGH